MMRVRQSTGSRPMRSAGRRLLAVASGVVMVMACIAMPGAALASAADSCHGALLSHGRCDGASSSWGPSVATLPANPLQVPGPSVAGRLAWQEQPDVPDDSHHAPLSARAPPLV